MNKLTIRIYWSSINKKNENVLINTVSLILIVYNSRFQIWTVREERRIVILIKFNRMNKAKESNQYFHDWYNIFVKKDTDAIHFLFPDSALAMINISFILQATLKIISNIMKKKIYS